MASSGSGSERAAGSQPPVDAGPSSSPPRVEALNNVPEVKQELRRRLVP